MTDSDIMTLSVIFNIILLFHNWLMHRRYNSLGELFGKTVNIMGYVADGKAAIKRDSKGDIHIKDLRNEKDKPSTTTV